MSSTHYTSEDYICPFVLPQNEFVQRTGPVDDSDLENGWSSHSFSTDGSTQEYFDYTQTPSVDCSSSNMGLHNFSSAHRPDFVPMPHNSGSFPASEIELSSPMSHSQRQLVNLNRQGHNDYHSLTTRKISDPRNSNDEFDEWFVKTFHNSSRQERMSRRRTEWEDDSIMISSGKMGTPSEPQKKGKCQYVAHTGPSTETSHMATRNMPNYSLGGGCLLMITDTFNSSRGPERISKRKAEDSDDELSNYGISGNNTFSLLSSGTLNFPEPSEPRTQQRKKVKVSQDPPHAGPSTHTWIFPQGDRAVPSKSKKSSKPTRHERKTDSEYETRYEPNKHQRVSSDTEHKATVNSSKSQSSSSQAVPAPSKTSTPTTGNGKRIRTRIMDNRIILSKEKLQPYIENLDQSRTCPLCLKLRRGTDVLHVFRTKTELTRHILTTHSDVMEFECTNEDGYRGCGNFYSRKDALQRHKNSCPERQAGKRRQ